MDEEFSDFKVVIKFLRITQDQESLKLLLEHGLLLLSIEDDAKRARLIQFLPLAKLLAPSMTYWVRDQINIAINYGFTKSVNLKGLFAPQSQFGTEDNP